MRKIADTNMFEEICNELDPNETQETSVIDKSAFDLGIGSSALAGALTGAFVASKKAKGEILKRQMENDNTQSISGNYYSQMHNIANGLRPIFTPFGVTYTVKNNGKEVALENIETEEMNKDMYAAWQHKDEDYFKNILLNKMHSDIQLVERHFAKNFIENQMQMENKINKKASEDEDDYASADEMSEFEMLNKIADIKDFYGRHTTSTEKMAEVLTNISDDGTMFKISWSLERPIEKYAGMEKALSILGFNDSGDNIKKYTNPSYLLEKVKVGFMPDRVVFMVDDKIISTLLAMHMNENAFLKFESQDKNYFVNMFKEEANKGINRMNGKIPPNSNITEKKASYEGLSQIFERGDIHPAIYFLVLTRKYTAEWMTWESEALIKILETDFDLKEGIADIPLNKILSVQVANRSDAIYTQYHAFEKVLRAFNNKPLDFFKREIDDVIMDEVAFTLEVLEKITPHEDIYKNFSQTVFNHMADMLLSDENKLFYPTAITGTPFEEVFIQDLNAVILDAANEQDISNIDNRVLESKTIQENEIIHHVGLDVLKKLRQMKEHYKTIDDEKFVNVVLDKIEIPMESHTKEIIKKLVLKNIDMDIFLLEKKALLKKQMNDFAL